MPGKSEFSRLLTSAAAARSSARDMEAGTVSVRLHRGGLQGAEPKNGSDFRVCLVNATTGD